MSILAATQGLPDLLPSDATNLAGQDTGREHLSHSSVALQLACPQKYAFHYIDRLETVSRPAPLSLGRAFQKALEHNDPNAGVEALRDGAAPVFSQQDEDKQRINEAVVRCGAWLYLDRWPAQEGEAREYEYRVRLRNPWTGHYSQTFDLLGYADALRLESDGQVLVENKFVGQISDLNVRRLPLDRQVALASYGIWRATGERVVKVRYRFVRKPSIKQKQNESVEQFVSRLEEDYLARGRDFYSHEETLYRSDDDLVRIEAELWEWADQRRRSYKQRLWPRNTSTCHEYGGCPYIPLCVGDPDAMSLYRVRERRPEISQSTTQEAA